MSIPTFAPSIGPSYEVQTQETYPADVQTSHKGYEVSRPLALRSIPPIQLQWKALKKPQLDEIKSFFDGFNGARGPFYWTPIDSVTAPIGRAPELGQVAGGALAGQGTYYVQYTWHQTSGGLETEGSKEASFAVSDNNLLTVTVPVFPLGVGEWRVYVGTSPGDAELQSGTVTERTWTMPAGGRDAGGANPPATNTLEVPRIFTHAGALQTTLLAPGIYSASIVLQQQTAAGGA